MQRDNQSNLAARRCHLCLEPIPLDALVIDPGTYYGPDRPRYFCCGHHLLLWTNTYQARWMRQAEAQRRVGRAGVRLMQRAVDRINDGVRSIRRGS